MDVVSLLNTMKATQVFKKLMGGMLKSIILKLKKLISSLLNIAITPLTREKCIYKN